MKVKDTTTGVLLESTNDLVTNTWKAQSDRYVPMDAAPDEPKPDGKKAEKPKG